MPRVLAFDINETLLDLAALDPHFEQALGNPAAPAVTDATACRGWAAGGRDRAR